LLLPPRLGYALDVNRLLLSPLLVLVLPLVLASGCAGPRIRVPGPVKQMGRERRAQVEALAAAHPESRAGGLAGAGLDAPTTDLPVRRSRKGSAAGEAVARQAEHLLGDRRLVVHGESYRQDCSGFVCAVYGGVGQALAGSSHDLYDRADSLGLLHKNKVPSVGDIAFFDNTHDRNGNGRRDDELSHVAIVESVDDDGIVTLVHYGSKGVARICIDLRHPELNVDEQGVLHNSILRNSSKGPRLSGELWRAWGSLWKAPTDQS